MMTFDFAVLGDSQPEGLLVAAGLLRKGFSVVVVPSSSLGELPADESWPMVLPSQLGQRKLNDLLFRAGFFRLEESGLTAQNQPFQVLLPKNRLLFDGNPSQWLSEIEREFPYALKTFSSLLQNPRKVGKPQIARAAAELFEIQKKNIHFRSWISAELHSIFRPSGDDDIQNLLKLWLQFILRQESKAYRVDPKMKAPYHHFLLEHARKWGAVVCTEPCDLKSVWTAFQVGKEVKASQLIVNGMGGGRIVARTLLPKLSEKMKSWMYFDSIHCPLSFVPEPLQEFSQINFGESVGELPSYRLLHLSVDRIRGEAHLSLGNWLSFEDSKSWSAQIMKGRDALKKLLPFMPEAVFKSIPSLLELTELRGECIRRGQADRLIPESVKVSSFQKVVQHLVKTMSNRSRLRMLARRIYTVTPHYLPYRNRLSSFEESLNFLDYFEKKKRKQVAAS